MIIVNDGDAICTACGARILDQTPRYRLLTGGLERSTLKSETADVCRLCLETTVLGLAMKQNESLRRLEPIKP